jgi:hypothetical protein
VIIVHLEKARSKRITCLRRIVLVQTTSIFLVLWVSSDPIASNHSIYKYTILRRKKMYSVGAHAGHSLSPQNMHVFQYFRLSKIFKTCSLMIVEF